MGRVHRRRDDISHKSCFFSCISRYRARSGEAPQQKKKRRYTTRATMIRGRERAPFGLKKYFSERKWGSLLLNPITSSACHTSTILFFFCSCNFFVACLRHGFFVHRVVALSFFTLRKSAFFSEIYRELVKYGAIRNKKKRCTRPRP